MKFPQLLLALAWLAFGFSAPAAITTGTLLEEMVDLGNLSRFPDPAYKTVQFSSYDRHSRTPYAPDWYANNDGFGKESIPNFLDTLEGPNEEGIGRYLLAEVEGPGAIVRNWTARISGRIEMTLDGAEKPLFQGEANDFFLYLYSHYARQLGHIDRNIEEGFHQRQACYFPIPFAKGLRVVWTGKLEDIHFYHLEVRRYPEGTEVQTFSPDDLSTYKTSIKRVLSVLSSKGAEWHSDDSLVGREFAVTLDPGVRKSLFTYEGEGSIGELTFKVESPDPHLALRQLVLQGFFDGCHQPQIEAPLGDFFGAGPGINPFTTLPMVVSPDGTMTCRFPMPFQTKAEFYLVHHGAEPVRVKGRVLRSNQGWDEGRSMHFYAKWRVDHGLLVSGERGVYDLPYLVARGKGVFVGCAAQILNPSRVPTSGGNWWGEGDEKIWVDNDSFPSFFGTGSEDYFNYAWSSPDLFDHAYFAQPLVTGPDNRGFNVNLRWHILDPLPFENHLAFYMELFSHTRTEDLTYARTVYFYGTPDIRDDIRPVTQADVTQGLDLPKAWIPDAQGAASGATFFQAEDLLASASATLEAVGSDLFSAGKAVRWTPSKEGQSIALSFPVEATGTYRLVTTFGYSPQSGKVAVRLDGGKPLEPVGDLYSPHQTLLRNVWFGEAGLSAGTHTFTFESKGKSEKSGGNRIDIDFVWIRPKE